MNLTKFQRLKEEATQLNAAARNLNERMRAAHDRKYRVQQELEAVQRDARNETQLARLKAEATEATAEFEQLHADALAAGDRWKEHAALVDRLERYLMDQGVNLYPKELRL
jgi:3-hydroxyisobutyrate dehydrogenase-like beta-hydroxyacid dehydrogenase